MEFLGVPSWDLLCFWIYVNDMPPAVKSNLLLYAYLPTRCKEINIKQQAQVTYLGCVLDESISGEPMALWH